MKKIIFLSPRYLPAVGGVEKHAAHIAQELVSRGYAVTVLTTAHQPKLKSKETIDGVVVHRLPFFSFNKKLLTWQWIWRKRRLIEEADILHIHDVFWWYLPLRLLFWRKKVFTTFHGYEGEFTPRWQAIQHRRLNEKLSYKTMAVGDFISKWYGQKPDFVTYGASNALAKSLAEIAPKVDTACFIGRLESDTGIEVYLQTLTLVKKKINLAIYGEGSLGQELRQQAKDQRLLVKFGGWTAHPLVKLAQCRFAFASQYLSILEAMQTKRLVVAVYTNDLKKDYLMCHPMAANMLIAFNAYELADKLNKITKLQEKAMVGIAYNWASKQTWPKLTDQYLEMWGLL